MRTSRSPSCSPLRSGAPGSRSFSSRCASPASAPRWRSRSRWRTCLAQGFGWPWSENLKPSKDSRFATAYSLLILLAAVPIALGADPLKLTNISMVLSAASLPVTVIPLLVLMNDQRVMTTHCNGWLGNTRPRRHFTARTRALREPRYRCRSSEAHEGRSRPAPRRAGCPAHGPSLRAHRPMRCPDAGTARAPSAARRRDPDRWTGAQRAGRALDDCLRGDCSRGERMRATAE